MTEKYVNYVNLSDGTDLLDLRHDSVKPEFLLLGETAHDATGKPIIGTLVAEESNIVDSGQCGENAFWELYENGLLVISGSGEMYNYGSNIAKGSPFVHRTDITDVIIRDGITSIGDYLFVGCASLENIVIPDGVVRIGESAFMGCRELKSVSIPYGCTKIEEATFLVCLGLSKLVIPDSVTEIKRQNSISSNNVPADIFYTGTKEQWDSIAISEDGNEGIFTATLHCEYEEATAKEEQEVTYPTITQNGSYEILPDEGKVMSKAIVEVDVKEADTVDGWHISVRDDGSNPPSGVKNTLTFVYTAGG